MKLTSIPSIVEITPYIGTHSKAFSLLSRLSLQSSRHFTQIQPQLSKLLSISTIDLGFPDPEVISYLLSNPKILSLFRLQILDIHSKQSYLQISRLLRESDPKSLDLILTFRLGCEDRNQLCFENLRDEGTGNTRFEREFGFIEDCIEIEDVIKEKGILAKGGVEWVMAQELHLAVRVEIIKVALFVLKGERNEVVTLAGFWERFRKSSKAVVEEVMIVWDLMTETELEKFIGMDFGESKVRVIVENCRMDDVIGFLENYSLPQGKCICFDVIPTDHLFSKELTIREAGKFNSKEFWIKNNSQNKESYVKITDFEIQTCLNARYCIPEYLEFFICNQFGCEFYATKMEKIDSNKHSIIKIDSSFDSFRIPRAAFSYYEVLVDLGFESTQYYKRLSLLDNAVNLQDLTTTYGFVLKHSIKIMNNQVINNIEIDEILLNPKCVDCLINYLKDSLCNCKIIFNVINNYMLISIFKEIVNIKTIKRIRCNLTEQLVFSEYLKLKSLANKIRERENTIVSFYQENIGKLPF